MRSKIDKILEIPRIRNSPLRQFLPQLPRLASKSQQPSGIVEGAGGFSGLKVAIPRPSRWPKEPRNGKTTASSRQSCVDRKATA